jgi:seryl-tRNA synthetase
MLDRRYIIENADFVARSCEQRNAKADVRRLVELETVRRQKQAEVQELNRQANEVSRTIGQAKDAAEREARRESGRQLRQQKDAAQAEHDRLDAEVLALQATIPNISHPQAPVGPDETFSREVRRGQRQARQFDFRPLDHVALCEKLDLLDLEAGARTTGHGFYFLKNEAVLLELALQRYALDLLLAEGFTPMITPDLARDDVISGIGFSPRGPETQIYSIENSDLSLIATAEITLGGLYAGQTLDADQLPVKLCGVSHCYRTEAGAHGRATRGIYRVHQFTKVEMFAYTLPDRSDAMHEYLCELECRLFDGLGIPYRVIDTATGDLGGPAYRKFDLEAWMPGRGENGEWGEITSTSNCTDYQARRLNARYKVKGEKGTDFVHTLNGTAVAVSRALIALLENFQQADGSVVIPEALRTWVSKERILPRR